MPRKTKRAHLFLISLMITLIVISAFIIKTYAESRSKDFVIDTIIIPQGIYADRKAAEENVMIQKTSWSMSSYCMVATITLGEGSRKITTSIVVKVPSVEYALNMGSAKASIAGEC